MGREFLHTRRRIHYTQVIGEVLLNYFQRWSGYEMGRETPFPPNQRRGYLPRGRINLGGQRRGRIRSPLLHKLIPSMRQMQHHWDLKGQNLTRITRLLGFQSNISPQHIFLGRQVIFFKQRKSYREDIRAPFQDREAPARHIWQRPIH